MKLSEFTGDMEVIQKLATFPNADDGLTAEQLKAKFDQAPAALKEYINNTLVPAVRKLQSKGGSLVVTVADGVADKSLAEVLAAAEEQRHVVLLFGEMRLGLIHADESGAIFTAVADGQMTAKVVMDTDGMLSEQTFQLASKSALRDTSNELMGVRTGWDGTGYATAGQAVRCQFNEMNMQVENLARAVDAAAEADYYDSFSVAIADINAGVRTGKCTSGTGCVKVVTGDTGKVTAILLDDCYEQSSVTISADVDIALAGHTLSFTTAGAYLNFASGKCAIWGNVPGSRIINENLSAAEQVKLFSVLCEHLEVHGGEYRMTGTIDKTSMMFQIARVNQYCLFEDCTVYSDIYSTGDSVTEVDGVTKVAGFYQFANITNTGGNTVVKGGSWSVCTSGNNRAVMFSNVGTLTAEGVAIEVEAVNHNAVAFMNQAATVGEEQKYGTFHIRNCAISVRTDAEVIFNSFGVFNQYSGTVCHISDSTLFTDSRDFDTHEDGLGTWAVAIQNAVGATCYVTNVVAHGTHSCLSNQGKMYVNGGTYTGFCHGGIYCSHGAEGEAFVNDAHLRDGHYEGIYPDHYETNKIHSVGGFYIGGGESEICSNMSAYFDGCTIEGVYRAFVMRGSSGEHNNKAYLSNCELIAGDVARAINIHEPFNTVYLTNCNYGKENATISNCVFYTDTIYRKSANDKDLNTLVDYASKTAEIAKTLIVAIGFNENGEPVADKTYKEIQKAYNEGRNIVVDADGALLSMASAPDGNVVSFSVNVTVFSIVATIYADNTVVCDAIELADMIPTKVSQLENDAEFIDLPSCTILGNNLRRRAEVVEGYFISPSSGNPAVAPNCQYATVAIPEIDELTIGFGCYIYAFEASNTGGVSFWDRNMNNLGVLDVKDYKIAYTHKGFPCATLPVPEGAAYVRYTVRMWNSNTGAEKWNANQTMLVAPGTADDVQDPRIATICGYGVCVAARKKDKKLWAVIGDSISAVNTTAMVKYHDYVAQELGLLVSNHARSGAGFTSGTTFSAQIAELAQEDCDVITIFTSGNDCDNDPPLGSVTDTGSDTLCGVINTTLDELFALKPFVSVGIITSCPWKWFMPSTPGNLMENYNNAIMEIARRRGIPVLDLYHSSNMRPDDEGFRVKFYNENGVQDNGVHPNSEGHKILAAPIREFVRSLIRP